MFRRFCVRRRVRCDHVHLIKVSVQRRGVYIDWCEFLLTCVIGIREGLNFLPIEVVFDPL